jgi:hypothetical protein
LGRAIKRGSAIDKPVSLVSVIREFASGDTPDDSPLTLKTLLSHEDYRDLSTAKLAVGDVAFDFELPRYDFSGATAVATGATVQLSEFRSLKPVALIFGSYT